MMQKINHDEQDNASTDRRRTPVTCPQCGAKALAMSSRVAFTWFKCQLCGETFKVPATPTR